MKKITTILGAGFLLASGSLWAAEAEFADATEGGIGYEWTVKIGPGESVDLLGAVGGKSSWEPAFELPDKGWTHTSDWVALELTSDARIEFTVKRQQGFNYISIDRDSGEQSNVTAGAHLYPAVSVYDGWDSTTEQESGSFNPAGNFWSTIQFRDVVYSQSGEAMVRYVANLSAGRYTFNIGGANDLYCNEGEACASGQHGYHAMIKAWPQKLMK